MHDLSMRFVHSGDWQIGMAAAQVGAVGDRVRGVRLDTCGRVAEVCRKESVDFLVLAGDTFEHNGVSRELVSDVIDRLRSMPCPVFVIPGNHDPLQPGSVWEHAGWVTAGNVHVLRTREPRLVPGGVLFPCPLFRRRSTEDPTAWIDAGGADGIRIGIAHGHAGETPNGDGGYPIAVDAPRRTGLDYLALGHWHSTTMFGERMAYSGTHEQTSFGERDSGNVLVVDIQAPDASPVVQPVRTGILSWQQIDRTITMDGELADVARSLARLPDAPNQLVDLTLDGILFQRDADEIERIQKACGKFLFARINRVALRPAPEDEDWVTQLPVGAVREAARRLRQIACSQGRDAEIATQALLELYAIASEVAA
jgi:DNA repair exonuclease SbcCD nuclease subunit